MITLSFQEAADRVKASLDIIDVIQRHVVLKKAGRNYLGLCPFHKDKHPSMNVSREKRMFKCFACGEGGDALAFLMKIENKTFGELIRDLALDQGIEIIREGQSVEAAAQARDFKSKILDLNRAAHDWFQQQLKSEAGASVREYLSRRGTTPDVIARFGLGYALPGWENLGPHLARQFDFVRENPDILSTAGFSNARDNGQGQYDRFRNRLIIPIHDEKGQVVAFGGRALSDEDKPKYLNSPETLVYHKSEVLYGFHLAKDAIRQHKRAVVMEGYFDVIAAHTAGLTEAVGSCGTALTDQHLKLLTRYGAETVYLAFDSDEAGLKAALSAIQMIEPYMNGADLSLKVLIVPDGKDPDDFARGFESREAATAAFQNLMTQARDYLTFKFDMAIRDLPLESAEGRIQAASRLTPLLAALNRPTVRSEYLRLYAEKIGVSEEALQLEIRRFEQARLPVHRRDFGQTKNSGYKKAISKGGRTSLERHQPRLTDNVSQLLVSLPSRHEAIEKNLLRLYLYNWDTFAIMSSWMHNQTDLEWNQPVHRQILLGLQAEAAKIDPSDNGNLGTIIENMNHQFLEQPAVIQTFAELVLTAESFGDSLDLGTLKGSQLREKVTAFAESQVVQLESFRRKRQLEQLTRLEADEIERQYQIRDHLRPPGQQPDQTRQA